MQASAVQKKAARRRTGRDRLIDLCAVLLLLGLGGHGILGTIQLAEDYRARQSADRALACGTATPSCAASAALRAPGGSEAAGSEMHLPSKEARVAGEVAGALLIIAVSAAARWWPRRRQPVYAARRRQAVRTRTSGVHASERMLLVVDSDRNDRRAA